MNPVLRLICVLMLLLQAPLFAASDTPDRPAYPVLADGSAQYAAFPKPLETYPPA